MPQQKFRETSESSFFGTLIYDRIIPANHFLRILKGMVDWEVVSRQLLAYYMGGAEYGAPPYDPALILRMLFISDLFKLSERQTEEFVNYHLPAKFFVGLGVDESAPDHSTLSVFRKRMIEKDGEKAFRVLFEQVVKLAQRKGVKFGKVQVVDSMHTVADVNVEKDRKRQGSGKAPRDVDARWGAKGKKKVKGKNRETGENEEKEVTDYFYGYKMHVSLNAEAGIITSMVFTSGEAYDGHQLPKLVEEDEAKGIDAEIYTADKAYDDGENHEFLASKGKKSGIKLNRYRTEKKDGNKEKWLKMKEDPGYKEGLAERYRVEQKFGEAKVQHGLGRCQYLNLIGYKVQGYLTAIVMNLKRIVKVVTGVGFRSQGVVGIGKVGWRHSGAEA